MSDASLINRSNLGDDILIHIWEYIPFFVIANGRTFAIVSRVAYKRFHRHYASLLVIWKRSEPGIPYHLLDVLRQLSKISLASNRTKSYACLLSPSKNSFFVILRSIFYDMYSARPPHNKSYECCDLFKELLHYAAVECIQDNHGDLEMSVKAYVKDFRHLAGIYLDLGR